MTTYYVTTAQLRAILNRLLNLGTSEFTVTPVGRNNQGKEWNLTVPNDDGLAHRIIQSEI